MPRRKKKGGKTPRQVLTDPKESRLAKLKKWSMAHVNKLPATFSPEATNLQSTLSSASLEESQSWITGRVVPKKVPKALYDRHVEEESRFRVSSIIPEHRIVRGIYGDPVSALKKRQRAELQRLREPSRNNRSPIPDYGKELRQIKLEHAVNRPEWNSSTAVLYPKLDPRQLERENSVGSNVSGQAGKSASRTSPSRAALMTFPITPSSPHGRAGEKQKYLPSRRALDPIRHVKHEQGNVVKVLTAMKTDVDDVNTRLSKDEDKYRSVAESEYIQLARFMANAAISRLEQVALIEVDISVPQTMQEQMATMTEEMLGAAVQVKQLRDVTSILFVWEIQDDINQLLDEAAPIVRQSPVITRALQDLEEAVATHFKEVTATFPIQSSSIEHAITNADDPLPLPSVMWGEDVGEELGKLATSAEALNVFAQDIFDTIKTEKEAIEERIEKDRVQRQRIKEDVLGPGHELLDQILDALETMPTQSGLQGATGLVATYDRARAVLAVVERAWAVEVDMTSPTHVDEVLQTLVEYAAIFMDAVRRSYDLVVGARQCAASITEIQDMLGHETTPQQILRVPSIVDSNQSLDESIGRTQGSVWTCSGGDIGSLYPKAFEAHVNNSVAQELENSAETEDDDLAADVMAIFGSEDGGDGSPSADESISQPITDEEILTEPRWMRTKVDEMMNSVKQLNLACQSAREVVDREVPLIKERKLHEEKERKRLQHTVDIAAEHLTHFESVLATGHPQLKLVPEVEQKMQVVRQGVQDANEALSVEVDLTTPNATSTALRNLEEQCDDVLRVAQELALKLETHATELNARVRRETLGRQQLNRQKMPAIRTAVTDVETTLAAAHPQVCRIESVKSNVSEFVARFNALQTDLRSCVDVTSQSSMSAALKSLDHRCDDIGSEAAFVLALINDEEAAFTKRLDDFENLRKSLQKPLMWAGIADYEAAVELYNTGPDQLRSIGGEAARLIAAAKDQLDTMVTEWKLTPNLTSTDPSVTTDVLNEFKLKGEKFAEAMAQLKARIRTLVEEMEARIHAETTLRQDIRNSSVLVAQQSVSAIVLVARKFPHLQQPAHDVNVALKALAALVVESEDKLNGIAVDITSDEDMARDMAKLRTCADSLDKVRKEAQDALHLEQARMSARRKIVADGANDIHNTLFMAILKQQEAFEKQVSEAPPKFAAIDEVVSMQEEIRSIVKEADLKIEKLLERADGPDLIVDDEVGIKAVVQLRQELGPLQIRCGSIVEQLASQMGRLLERQAEDVKRRGDLRNSRLEPAELVLAEVNRFMKTGGERLQSDTEIKNAVAAATASVAKCHHLLDRRLDFTTSASLEADYKELMRQLAHENTLERCEHARALIEQLIERSRASDGQFWTNIKVIGKMRRAARRTRFNLKLAGWRQNRLAAAKVLQQTLQEHGRRLHLHPQFEQLYDDHFENDGESLPGGREMTLALDHADAGAEDHWTMVDTLQAAATEALGTKFDSIGKRERALSGGSDSEYEDDFEEDLDDITATNRTNTKSSGFESELDKIESKLAAYEVELKRTKLHFDGLEKRLEERAAAARKLAEEALLSGETGAIAELSAAAKLKLSKLQDDFSSLPTGPVAQNAAMKLQRAFRRQRAMAVLDECHFDGEVHDLDQDVMDMINSCEDSLLLQQARACWGWENQRVRVVHVTREDDWQTRSLGISAELPTQIDLNYHGHDIRVSDPFVLVKALKEGSFLADFGIRAHDAILTVNGRTFETIGEFVGIIKQHKDFDLEVAHLADTPGWRQDDISGLKTIGAFKRKILNAIAMRIAHEVRVRDEFVRAHEHDAVPPQARKIPVLASEKLKTLDCLRAFVALQAMPTAHAPILCAVATAVEDTGALPLASGKHVGQYCKPTTQKWLAARLDEWRRRLQARQTGGKGPSHTFLEQHAIFAKTFPKDFGRRVGPGIVTGAAADEGSKEPQTPQEQDLSSSKADASTDDATLKRRKKKRVKQGPRPEGFKGESWDVLHGVDGLVKTASGRYIKP